ncbi:MAG: dCTP deaminase [Candidatus Nanoarchaeia archaeon]|jgi:deoxycytidine triphosphate deaminase
MILTGSEIKRQVNLKRIHITPFIEENLNPNSYNFRLGKTLKVYRNKTLDSAKEMKYREIEIPKAGYVLKPNQLYIGHTIEEMGSDYYVPTMQARSSVGRLGLYIYLNSGLGDIGFKRQWTLELQSIHNLRVYEGMKVGQMLFWKPQGKIVLYNGKYKNAVGAQTSKIWMDFKK